ncbi:MAG: hypothetical protein IMY87_02610 [Chloroflexi bacterium]|nr:hypothetical protein [Chloroflexota bacterium]
MPLRRTTEGWRTDRHKWEVENKIVVTGIGRVSEGEKQIVANCIRMLLSELGFALEVGAAASSDNITKTVNEMLRSSLSRDAIDADCILGELNRRRKEDSTLRAAIVIAVNPDEYAFTDPLAIYGVGYEDGLVILRDTRKEAVRHEMGHMLGIHSHCDKNPNCVMRWECPSEYFCRSCEASLKALWHYAKLE